jgi:phosphatidylserine/phosphatidylglycerophosphate/cardiolipin synthase-like enzyme
MRMVAALLPALLLVRPAAPAETLSRIENVRVAFSPRGDALDLILDEIRAADHRIDLAMFYLSNDLLLDALCYVAAHKQVQLTLYVDGEMAAPSHRAALDRLHRHGAEIYVDALGSNGKLHLKTLVVDGRKVITGSSNWTQTAFSANCEDTVSIESDRLGAYYLARFDWLKTQCVAFVGETYETNDLPGRFPSAPGMSRDHKGDRLVAPREAAFSDVSAGEAYLTPGREGILRLSQLVGQALRRIDIAIYSISDPEVIAALTAAAGTRGVKVRIIVDDTMLTGSRLRYLQELHQAGADIHYLEHAHASLHLKSAVIDEQVVCFGSHNWTPSAAAKNMEDMLLFSSRRMARHYLDYFDYIVNQHACPFATIERERVAESDDGAPRAPGLQKAGTIHYPASLPATGPRKRFDDIFHKRPTEPFRVDASLQYLDDGDYLPVLLQLLHTANQSILVSLYHIAPAERSTTVHELLDALGEAAERGLYTYLVLNMPENQSDTQQASHSRVAEELRARGVDVRLCVPGVQLHEKVVVVDLAKILIGSHNWSGGAVTGDGGYESSALLVLPRQDPRFARHILRHPVVSDMRDRERWENELSLLRHISSFQGEDRAAYIRTLEAGR